MKTWHRGPMIIFKKKKKAKTVCNIDQSLFNTWHEMQASLKCQQLCKENPIQTIHAVYATNNWSATSEEGKWNLIFRQLKSPSEQVLDKSKNFDPASRRKTSGEGCTRINSNEMAMDVKGRHVQLGKTQDLEWQHGEECPEKESDRDAPQQQTLTSMRIMKLGEEVEEYFAMCAHCNITKTLCQITAQQHGSTWKKATCVAAATPDVQSWWQRERWQSSDRTSVQRFQSNRELKTSSLLTSTQWTSGGSLPRWHPKINHWLSEQNNSCRWGHSGYDWRDHLQITMTAHATTAIGTPYRTTG